MAHMKWFGDVYTYTHRVLLHAIAEPGEWFVHPMLFRSEGKRPRQPGGGLDAATYADAIGLPFGMCSKATTGLVNNWKAMSPFILSATCFLILILAFVNAKPRKILPTYQFLGLPE